MLPFFIKVAVVKAGWLFVKSPRFQFPFQAFREPEASKGRCVRGALTRKLAKHRLHGGRQAHIELGGVILENCFSESLVQIAVILHDFRYARSQPIEHVMGFCPADNLFIGAPRS